MDESEKGEGWYRRKVGRRIERGMNRLIAGLLAAIGFVAGYLSLPAEDHGPRWFGLIAAVVLFWLARKCFTARRSVIDGFGEEPGPSRRRKG